MNNNNNNNEFKCTNNHVNGSNANDYNLSITTIIKT